MFSGSPDNGLSKGVRGGGGKLGPRGRRREATENRERGASTPRGNKNQEGTGLGGIQARKKLGTLRFHLSSSKI